MFLYDLFSINTNTKATVENKRENELTVLITLMSVYITNYITNSIFP